MAIELLPSDELGEVLACFPVDGQLVGVEPLHRGHIHDTYVSRWETAAGGVALLHQRINPS